MMKTILGLASAGRAFSAPRANASAPAPASTWRRLILILIGGVPLLSRLSRSQTYHASDLRQSARAAKAILPASSHAIEAPIRTQFSSHTIETPSELNPTSHLWGGQSAVGALGGGFFVFVEKLSAGFTRLPRCRKAA